MTPPPLVLAYHGLREVPPARDPHNLMVAPEAFAGHVRALASRGYRFVGLAELARDLAAGADLRGRCALTFDDGTSELSRVLPELLPALNARATVFACPGLLGEPHPDVAPAAGVRLLDRAELRALAGHPLVELGSHTRRHTSLAEAGEAEAFAEMSASKLALEELAGAPVETFAYPGCAYSAACPPAARRAGYLAAVTCGGRGAWTPYELRRESVDRLDGRLTFALKSRGWFWPLWRSPPGRLARRLARPARHGESTV
jgi:peptidoglycan/xylan/chitin deacetylase (PgdA/CDA1 family)